MNTSWLATRTHGASTACSSESLAKLAFAHYQRRWTDVNGADPFLVRLGRSVALPSRGSPQAGAAAERAAAQGVNEIMPRV